MYLWDVFYENADMDEPRQFIGMIQGDSQAQALEKSAQFYERPGYDLVVQRAMSETEANAQAVQCAVDQAPGDMILTPVEVMGASLYKRVEMQGDALQVRGVRWYVEVELRNLQDSTGAWALYRVWREDATFKAIRVELR